MNYPSFQIEELYWENDQHVVGLDESGRGCLAGPVFAAAVIFPQRFDLIANISNFFSKLEDSSSPSHKLYLKIINNPKLLINDSKVLDVFTREIAFDFIVKFAYSFSISQVDEEIIDNINILQASQLAFRKCLEKLRLNNEHILIDGNYFKKYKNLSYETVVKGDSKSYSIAAASILAKVSRDRYMKSVVHKKYPEYSFNHHVGYATKEHFNALEKFGETEFHRKSFLKKYFERKSEMSKQSLF